MIPLVYCHNTVNPICVECEPGHIALFVFVSDEKKSYFSPVIKIRYVLVYGQL